MVPCLVNSQENTLLPLVTPVSLRVSSKRKPWLLAEDDQLKLIAEGLGKHNWPLIAKRLNETVHRGFPLRRAKQCRERYYNHLVAGLNKSKWSETEESDLRQLQQRHGNCWSSIAKFFPGRTENQVKNRFRLLQLRERNA